MMYIHRHVVYYITMHVLEEYSSGQDAQLVALSVQY